MNGVNVASPSEHIAKILDMNVSQLSEELAALHLAINKLGPESEKNRGQFEMLHTTYTYFKMLLRQKIARLEYITTTLR